MTITNINDLYEALLEDGIDLNLVGEISLEDENIKWEYDGISQSEYDMDVHLNDTFDADRDTLTEYIAENNIGSYFHIHEPEVDESIVTSDISEK